MSWNPVGLRVLWKLCFDKLYEWYKFFIGHTGICRMPTILFWSQLYQCSVGLILFCTIKLERKNLVSWYCCFGKLQRISPLVSESHPTSAWESGLSSVTHLQAEGLQRRGRHPHPGITQEGNRASYTGAGHWYGQLQPLITLRLKQNGRHFPDDIFKCISLNENVWILIKISLKFVLKGPINNIPALVQIMAWHRPGDKPLSEPMMVSLLTHICVTRPQWVILTVMSWTQCQKLGQFAMPEPCKNWLALANSCIYYARQTFEIYLVLPYSVDFKASQELWNPLSKAVLGKCIWN